MRRADTASRIRGCILGAALGDAVGAPFEFQPIDRVVDRLGHEWVDGLYPFEGECGPHGVWRSPAPLGTGTDDTRYNWILLELAAELGHLPSESQLAERLLAIAEAPGATFPLSPQLAWDWLRLWEAPSRGVLGQASADYPGVPPGVLRERSLGLNFPTLIGLITFTTAGVLFAGDPEQAYRATYAADYLDVGFAKEAVGLLSAAIAGAVASDDPAAAVRAAITLDPYSLGGPFGGPYIHDELPSLLAAVPADASDEDLAEHLSRALDGMHPFDPYKTLAIAVAAVLARPAEPFRAILIAANHRAINADGSLGALLDIDYYACVAGALAGAVAGDEAFPEGMLEQTIAANRDVYAFDLGATATRIAALPQPEAWTC